PRGPVPRRHPPSGARYYRRSCGAWLQCGANRRAISRPDAGASPCRADLLLRSSRRDGRRPRRQLCAGRAPAPAPHAASQTGRGAGATGGVMLRLYMDVHVKAAITAGLRRRGIDVVTAQEDGGTRLEDTALLERATALQRVLFSQDDDLLAVARA